LQDSPLSPPARRVILWCLQGPELRAVEVSGCVQDLGYPEQSWREPGVFLRRVHADDRGSLLEAMHDAAVRGGASRVHRLLRADGRCLWWRTAIRAESNRGLLRAVSVQVEEQPREQGSSRRLIETVQDYAVFLVSPQGEIASWSSEAGQLHGYTEEEIVHTSWARLFSPAQMQPGTVEQLLARAARDGRAEYEGWLLRKGGERFWGNVLLNAVVDEQGQLLGFGCLARDLTARVMAERAQAFLLEASVALARCRDYRTTLEAAVGVAVAGLSRACVLHTLRADLLEPVAVAHAAARSELLRGALVPLSLLRRVSRGLARVAACGRAELCPETSGAPEAASDLGIRPSVFQELAVRSYICVPLASDGAPFGTMTLLTDERPYGPVDLALAERLARRLALALEKAQLYERTRQALHTRDEILAVVSHDLRSPLNVIRMAARLLRAEAGAGAAELIERSVERMEHTIRDLLDVSILDSGQLTMEPSECDVSTLVSEAAELLWAVAADKGVRVETEPVVRAGRVRCDRNRIGQVFSNLVGNAIKFTEAGGVVRVGAEVGDGHARFWVCDTGIGMSPEELPHIFDRFWRGERSRQGGHGLGLAIAKGIIETHGGELSAESVLGQGTIFSFTLPTADST
jgi:PAS domain S-box-containing protein